MDQHHLLVPDESQQQLCAKYQLPLQPPEEMVAIALGTLHQSPVYGSRVPLPENGTLSWFFHCGEYSAENDFYQAMHIEHLAEKLPDVVKYLFLPVGAKFIIDRAGYEDVWMTDSESCC